VAELREIVEFLDTYLRIDEVPDYPGAHNGLQVENRSPIERISAATDACQSTIDAAVAAGSQLLLVHHGLFWGDVGPAVGIAYRRLRTLFEADVAVYSAHLPLDVHAEVGNNVLLARALGLEVEGRFGVHRGVEGIGVWATADLPLPDLLKRVGDACGEEPMLIAGGPTHVRRLGIVSGGAGGLLAQAHAAGLDTFLTGEGTHHTYHEATELGLNLVYAGHYATETFGVEALARKTAERFGLDWEFIDQPTGM
jgi:dinuclear metal center YbgI/SA1388 family protein